MRALLVCIAIAGVTSPALAAPTKVALTIDGDSSSIGLRKAVVGALSDDDLEFVSPQKTTRVIEQLGIGEVSSSKEAKSVAKKLDVDAVVQGAFDESDHTLKMTVFNVGKKATSFTIDAEDAKSSRFRKAIRKRMLAQIAVADSDDVVDEDFENDEEPAKPAKSAKSAKSSNASKAAKSAKSSKASKVVAKAEDDEEPVAKSAKSAKTSKVAATTDDEEPNAKSSKTSKVVAKAEHDEEPGAKSSKASKAVATKDEDESEVEGDEGDDQDGDDGVADDEEPPGGAQLRAESTAPSRPRNTAFPAIRIDVGGSMVGRSLKFTSSAAEGAPSSYRRTPVAGGHAAAEIYPMAISDRSRLIAGLGVGGELDQSTWLTAPLMDGSRLQVKQRQYSVGLRFRIGIGHRATSPTVTLGVGYAVRTIDVDNAMPTGVPEVDYRMIDPGLQLRVPIGRRIALVAGGRGILMLSAGAMTEAAQYGPARIKGGSANAGLELVLAPFVVVRVAGEGTQLDMKFTGQGMIDVQKARDRYYGGQATLAVMY